MMDFFRGLEAGEARPTESRSGPRGPGPGQGQGQSQGQGQGQRGALHASRGGRDDDDYNDTFIYDDEVRVTRRTRHLSMPLSMPLSRPLSRPSR